MSKRKLVSQKQETPSCCWFNEVPPEIVNEIAKQLMPLEVLLFSLTSHRQSAQIKPLKKRQIRIACLQRCHSCGSRELAHHCNVNDAHQPTEVYQYEKNSWLCINTLKCSSLFYVPNENVLVVTVLEPIDAVWRKATGIARTSTFMFKCVTPTTKKKIWFSNPVRGCNQVASVFHNFVLSWVDQTEDSLKPLLFSGLFK